LERSSERKSRSQFALLTERRFAPFLALVAPAATTPEYLYDAVPRFT